MKESAISDEQIIAALLQSGSIAQAAKLTGLAPRTVYDRMGKRTFKAAYSAAKTDIVRAAVMTMTRSMGEAVDVITGIMKDEKVNPVTRLQAAKTILENAAKFSDRLSAADSATASWAEPALSFDMEKW